MPDVSHPTHDDSPMGGGLVITAATELSDELTDALTRLLPQVSKRGSNLTADRIQQVLDWPGSTIYVACLADRIVGAATLTVLVTLVGRMGYLEEVVVDHGARGHGIAKTLIQHILDDAQGRGLDCVELTSRSERHAANRLYQSTGFAIRDTNVYRHTFDRAQP